MKNRFDNTDFGKPSKSGKSNNAVNWEKVDWVKSDEDLAQELNRGITYVSAQRKIYSPKPITECGVDWRAVDWNLSNDDLIELLKVPYAKIKKYRIKLSPQTVLNYLKPR